MNNIYKYKSIYTSSKILLIILKYKKESILECKVEFDEYLNLNQFFEKKEKSLNYRCLCIIVWIGNPVHYIAYCRGIKEKDQ